MNKLNFLFCCNILTLWILVYLKNIKCDFFDI